MGASALSGQSDLVPANADAEPKPFSSSDAASSRR
jgi:hypothetical protein